MSRTPCRRKSSYSGSGGGEGDTCVESAEARPRTAVRDSKAPARAVLSVPALSFAALVGHVMRNACPGA
ncbi:MULTISPECIES: DUF397 domain-containing protein [unclassified Streptomyces]|uniref:DUF397 domain-containing protein n=1 Tax=unclassified Streptomyces TaxID=2593676 RepID=UPI00073CEBAD|nr:MULTISPECIES: DUF397 domain-containing protein [unclassified Streptomyces]ODA73335.1 hypothetical protein APS67_002598 [Streptomyces sp. AVP053U2]